MMKDEAGDILLVKRENYLRKWFDFFLAKMTLWWILDETGLSHGLHTFSLRDKVLRQVLSLTIETIWKCSERIIEKLLLTFKPKNG